MVLTLALAIQVSLIAQYHVYVQMEETRKVTKCEEPRHYCSYIHILFYSIFNFLFYKPPLHMAIVSQSLLYICLPNSCMGLQSLVNSLFFSFSSSLFLYVSPFTFIPNEGVTIHYFLGKKASTRLAVYQLLKNAVNCRRRCH